MRRGEMAALGEVPFRRYYGSVDATPLSVDGMRSRVSFDHPALPQGLEGITIRRLRVGQGSVDLIIRRNERDVGIDVLDRVGRV